MARETEERARGRTPQARSASRASSERVEQARARASRAAQQRARRSPSGASSRRALARAAARGTRGQAEQRSVAAVTRAQRAELRSRCATSTARDRHDRACMRSSTYQHWDGKGCESRRGPRKRRTRPCSSDPDDAMHLVQLAPGQRRTHAHPRSHSEAAGLKDRASS